MIQNSLFNISTVGGIEKPLQLGEIPVYNAEETQAIFQGTVDRINKLRNSPAGKLNTILNWAINASEDAKEPMYRDAVKKLEKDHAEKFAADKDLDNIIEVILSYLPNKVPLPALLKTSFVNYFPFHPITTEVKKPTLSRVIIIAAVVVAVIAAIMFYVAKKQKL